MKHTFLNAFFFLIILHLSSCAGGKKFKALEADKLKLEQTLLTTKQELSEAKRELNKFKDSSNSNTEEQTGTIKGLNSRLEETQDALDAAQAAAASCQERLYQLETEAQNSELSCQEQLKPLLLVKDNLIQQNKSLKGIQEEIAALIQESPEIIMTHSLNKDELLLSFDHAYLFASSGRSLSQAGRDGIYKLAELLKKYPSIYIDINGHVPSGGDTNDNWKNSTRKTLSVLYTLTYKGVLPDRIRVIGYGEYAPIATEENADSKKLNSRTEIILRYQNYQLLKLIPLK